ncbi:MAG: acetolactate decarboxylase [Acidimicrobiia bacterium]
MAPHELRCRIPEGLWRALQQRSAETGEPVRHLVSTALAELLDVEHQTMFQVSTVGALVEGVYEGAVRVGTLREHGDFGLGTFEGLDGEMVALDGDVFQVRMDGALHRVDDDVLSPYAMVTHFVPDNVAPLPACTDLAALCSALDERRDSANHFFAFRIDGRFPSMHVRAACKVPEGTPLVDATAIQREWNLNDVGATLVGFWSPSYAAHFDVPGYHFHMVDDERQRGGHVLDCAIQDATAATQRLEQLVVALPETADFLTADLQRDPSATLDSVERDH